MVPAIAGHCFGNRRFRAAVLAIAVFGSVCIYMKVCYAVVLVVFGWLRALVLAIAVFGSIIVLIHVVMSIDILSWCTRTDISHSDFGLLKCAHRV